MSPMVDYGKSQSLVVGSAAGAGKASTPPEALLSPTANSCPSPASDGSAVDWDASSSSSTSVLTVARGSGAPSPPLPDIGLSLYADQGVESPHCHGILGTDKSVFSFCAVLQGFLSASAASTVAIDNKIEQAMDLVKSHLMFAVREEVEVLKERIGELMERINHLECENTVLRQYASPEVMQQIQQQLQQPHHSSNS